MNSREAGIFLATLGMIGIYAGIPFAGWTLFIGLLLCF